jgi:hypothetical protein
MRGGDDAHIGGRVQIVGAHGLQPLPRNREQARIRRLMSRLRRGRASAVRELSRPAGPVRPVKLPRRGRKVLIREDPGEPAQFNATNGRLFRGEAVDLTRQEVFARATRP